MKLLTLCADDYAQSTAISRGIRRLLEAGRLNGVSCLTQSPCWPVEARKLRAIPGGFEAGLHFNLTMPTDGGRGRRVSTWLLLSAAGAIDRREILRTFDQQWDAFVAHYGELPAFVDGHQHVHLFPCIREVVIERAKQLNPRCWIRSLRTPSPATLFKERLLARVVRTPDAMTNSWFAGFRPYRRDFDLGGYFRDLLANCPTGTLIMCHPGEASNDPEDPLRECRPGELQYLMSDDFVRDGIAAGAHFQTLTPR